MAMPSLLRASLSRIGCIARRSKSVTIAKSRVAFQLSQEEDSIPGCPGAGTLDPTTSTADVAATTKGETAPATSEVSADATKEATPARGVVSTDDAAVGGACGLQATPPSCRAHIVDCPVGSFEAPKAACTVTRPVTRRAELRLLNLMAPTSPTLAPFSRRASSTFVSMASNSRPPTSLASAELAAIEDAGTALLTSAEMLLVGEDGNCAIDAEANDEAVPRSFAGGDCTLALSRVAVPAIIGSLAAAACCTRASCIFRMGGMGRGGGESVLGFLRGMSSPVSINSTNEDFCKLTHLWL